MSVRNKPLVSIVVPTHNRKEKVVRLIYSILNNTYNNVEIIVVDDASIDKTYNCLKNEFKNLPFFKVVRNKKNLLLANSRNVGINKSEGEFIFLIDDDNILHSECIEELVKFMLFDKTIGIAGPIIYFLDEPKKIRFAGCRRNYFTVTSVIGRNKIDTGLFTSPILSEDIPNSFMVRRELIDKIGLLDGELFPIHYDEADFGCRTRGVGYKIHVIPSAKIYHDEEPYDRTKDLARSYNVGVPFHAYFVARNRIIFHKKYSKSHQFLFFAFIFNWLITLFYLKLILFNNPRSFKERVSTMKSYLKGVIDGYLIAPKIKEVNTEQTKMLRRI